MGFGRRVREARAADQTSPPNRGASRIKQASNFCAQRTSSRGVRPRVQRTQLRRMATKAAMLLPALVGSAQVCAGSGTMVDGAVAFTAFNSALLCAAQPTATLARERSRTGRGCVRVNAIRIARTRRSSCPCAARVAKAATRTRSFRGEIDVSCLAVAHPCRAQFRPSSQIPGNLQRPGHAREWRQPGPAVVAVVAASGSR
mmetsp:Transcript_2189/g.6711  ORF Transcript_2189/g.6711 Transcript_2189/m.6711 type:complete len:201 (+) Transcript_2189:1175-1777(+)